MRGSLRISTMSHRGPREGGQRQQGGSCSPGLPSEDVVLTVFFEGTSNTLSNNITQLGMLYDLTEGVDITSKAPQEKPARGQQYKMAFDGCGATHGEAGRIFAYGLKQQSRAVVQRIRDLHSLQTGPVRLNCIGLSRGAVAVMYLAQMVKDTPRLAVRACLFDPVPGNLICTSRWFRFAKLSTASQCQDLSACRTLVRVLAVYPCEPLVDLAFHAPVFPTYPPTCLVEEDVTLGCHQNAVWTPPERSLPCSLSWCRLYRFLDSCGTSLRQTPLPHRKTTCCPYSDEDVVSILHTPRVEQLEEACLAQIDAHLRALQRAPLVDPASPTEEHGGDDPDEEPRSGDEEMTSFAFERSNCEQWNASLDAAEEEEVEQAWSESEDEDDGWSKQLAPTCLERKQIRAATAAAACGRAVQGPGCGAVPDEDEDDGWSHQQARSPRPRHRRRRKGAQLRPLGWPLERETIRHAHCASPVAAATILCVTRDFHASSAGEQEGRWQGDRGGLKGRGGVGGGGAGGAGGGGMLPASVGANAGAGAGGSCGSTGATAATLTASVGGGAGGGTGGDGEDEQRAMPPLPFLNEHHRELAKRFSSRGSYGLKTPQGGRQGGTIRGLSSGSGSGGGDSSGSSGSGSGSPRSQARCALRIRRTLVGGGVGAGAGSPAALQAVGLRGKVGGGGSGSDGVVRFFYVGATVAFISALLMMAWYGYYHVYGAALYTSY
jgi:hypothetical protein